jgi:predicted MFS family arabinose efflux permease
MTTTNSIKGRIVLSTAHVAGMIDLVALPVWVGTLISRYQFSPQQAGGLVTLFLVGAVAASLFFAPRFNRMAGRVIAPTGFALAALCFFGLSLTADYSSMALLHGVGGVAVGCSLSFTHGTIGRSANPHRLFAIAGLALGIFAIAFLGGVPQIVQSAGGPAMFKVFSGVMLVAAIATALAFPVVPPGEMVNRNTQTSATGIPRSLWFGIVGICLMTMTQATVFSFFERLGVDRGFGADRVIAVLIAVGFINLLPAVLAAVLQRKWSAHRVMLVAPAIQMLLALVITQSSTYPPYAIAGSVFVFVMIFTHTFAFGLFASLDPSGRAVAATPAMLMIGSAIGPILGGTLVQNLGYESLGYATVVISTMAVLCFLRAGRRPVQGGAAIA